MCRLAAWSGAPIALEDIIIKPSHSLLEQSQDATEAKFAVNGDGFGMAWYGDAHIEPGLYRDVLPAWSDANLASLAQMITSPLFMAHVRASTGGGTSLANCHPFRHGRWAFMHNGQLGGFARIRRHLEGLLPDALYNLRTGTSDSEVMFLVLLAFGLERDPENAIAQMLTVLHELRHPDEPPHRITCVLSNGVSLYAFREASDEKCPTLYQRRAENGVILASEPLDGETSGWTPVPPHHLLRVKDRKSTLTPLMQKMEAA